MAKISFIDPYPLLDYSTPNLCPCPPAVCITFYSLKTFGKKLFEQNIVGKIYLNENKIICVLQFSILFGSRF
jgi:hypothetical protein